MLALDQMLPADDEARTVVAFVEQCDLIELYDSIRVVEGQAGAFAHQRSSRVAVTVNPTGVAFGVAKSAF